MNLRNRLVWFLVRLAQALWRPATPEQQMYIGTDSQTGAPEICIAYGGERRLHDLGILKYEIRRDGGLEALRAFEAQLAKERDQKDSGECALRRRHPDKEAP